ncbi:MAG: Asp-tRNA(Asn)/Glu-tRNA(Gln) amidotransferase subunit GatC [Ferruginibacter sp.]
MEVNDAMIDKFANLAKLKFGDAEKQQIKSDLQNMPDFIDKMNVLDTAGVAPLLHITDNVNVLRMDAVAGSITNDAALQNAAFKNVPFFIVPNVIKN